MENGKLSHTSKNSKISEKVRLTHLKISWRVQKSLLSNVFLKVAKVPSKNEIQSFLNKQQKNVLCCSYWRPKYKAVLLREKWLCSLNEIYVVFHRENDRKVLNSYDILNKVHG